MTLLEFFSHLPCAVGAVVYALFAFYLTFLISVWVLELPFKLWEWWYDSE